MSWRSMVSKGFSAWSSVNEPVRNGTFWPTRIRASWLSRVVMLGVESRFDLVDWASAWIRMPYSSSVESPIERPFGVRAGGDRHPQQRQDVLERQAAFRERGGREGGVGRRVAEPELHAELLGDVAGDLGDRRLDQHLRTPLVELRHQPGQVVLHLGPGADHHGVDLDRRLDRYVLRGERGDRRALEAELGLADRGVGLLRDIEAVGDRGLLHRSGGVERLGDRVLHRRLGADADDAAQHLGHAGRVGVAKAVDAGDRHQRRRLAAGLVEVGDHQADPVGQLGAAADEQHVVAGVDRHPHREAALGAEHPGQRRGDLGGVDVADRDGGELGAVALVEAAGDRLDPVDVLDGVGDDEGVGLGQRLDVAEAGDQRPERGDGGGGGEVVELHQAGDDVEAAGVGAVAELAAAFAHHGLRDDAPDRARAQRREPLHPQHRLEEVPDPLLGQLLGRDDGDVAGDRRIEDQGAAGDLRDLLGQGADVGVAQVDHEARAFVGQLLRRRRRAERAQQNQHGPE